jgi:drug/metabolite transporter (DMT)-like permease
VLPIALAALTAVVWGGADYCGGRATQGRSALGVAVASQVLGLPALLLCLPFITGAIHGSDLAWGAGAGLAGFLGIILLYRSLSTGAMAVAAPITAVTAAVVPMAVGLAREQAPSVAALIGGGCALVGIALVSLGPSHTGGRATLSVIGLSLSAGTMFGLFGSLIAQTHDDSGLWPIVAARVASISVGLLVLTRVGGGLRVRPLSWIVAAGVGDVLANAAYLLAIRAGLLSVVAPIAALYPASTVLLALALDRERLRPVQFAGLGLAATALVLTAV